MIFYLGEKSKYYFKINELIKIRKIKFKQYSLWFDVVENLKDYKPIAVIIDSESINDNREIITLINSVCRRYGSKILIINYETKFETEPFDDIKFYTFNELDIFLEGLKCNPMKNNNFDYFDTLITEILFKLGFSPKLCGFQYIKDAVNYQNKDINKGYYLVGDIYNSLANNYHKSTCSIERAIRNSISNAWGISDIETWKSTLHNLSISAGYKPSNREFLNILYTIINDQTKHYS